VESRRHAHPAGRRGARVRAGRHATVLRPMDELAV